MSKKDDIKRLAAELAQKEPKGIHLLVNNGEIPGSDPQEFILVLCSCYRPR